jgi:hypothetical protein
MLSLLPLLWAAAVCLSQDAPTVLPATFAGRWQGTLEIKPLQGQLQSVPMELHIEPLKEGKGHTWRIIYGSGDRKQVREYQIRPEGKKPNAFIIDEQNGILLDAALAGNALHCQFKVSGNLLVARYKRRGEVLEYEILVFAAKAPRVSKVGPQGNLDVESYPLQTIQRAELRLQEKEKP